MKRTVAGLLVFGLVALLVALPSPARADGRFWTGFAIGGATGVIVGGAVTPRYYAPPIVLYEPAPVYVAPPAYVPVYLAPPAVYVPGQWVWSGYAWVWQPGYWRY